MRSSLVLNITMATAVLAAGLMAGNAQAKPYASLYEVSDVTLTTGESSDISFFLNSDASTVTLAIKGPAPATAAVKTVALGAKKAGRHSIAWDGTDDAAAPVADGDYTVEVTAEAAALSAWTNMTPVQVAVVDGWSTPTAELGWASTAVVGVPTNNSIRGLGVQGSNIIVASSENGQRKLSVLSTAGDFQFALGTTVTDPYDVNANGSTTDTLSFDGGAWPNGPYDIATTTDQKVFIGAIGLSGAAASPGFSAATVPTVAAGASLVQSGAFHTTGSRAMEVANSGASAIVYVTQGLSGGNISVYAGATSVTLVETIPSSIFATTEGDSHMIVARDGNTTGDGDVIWTSKNSGTVARFVRSGGVWAKDPAFVAANYAIGGDYVQLNGKDFVVVVGYAVDLPIGTRQVIRVLDGDTGELAYTYDRGVARLGNDGNGDLAIVKANASKADVYYGFSEHGLIGKFTLSYDEAPSGQYYSPNSIAVISDMDQPSFGQIAVLNSYPAVSGNAGATADQMGLFLIEPNFTWKGGNAAAAYAAAKNPATPTWSATDSMSPWKAKPGADSANSGVVYAGDWGTKGVTDTFYRYDFLNPATALIPSTTTTTYGRIAVGQTYQNGANTYLIALCRDWNGDTSADLLQFDVTGLTSGYNGTPVSIGNSPNLGLSGVNVTNAYSMQDMALSSDGIAYIANARWGTADAWVFAVDTKTKTGLWAKTGNDLAMAGGAYPRGIALDEANGKVYVFYRGTGKVGVHDAATGNLIESFTVVAGSSSTSARCGIAVDAAGNVYVSNNSTERVQMWSPAGAASVTTRAYTAVEIDFDTHLNDWMILAD